jgi:farnesyl-diphosphate farnesyltransferase
MRDFHRLLRSTSRTFAVGIESLPHGLREAVTLAYLVLRVSDYYEDSPTLPPRVKQRMLGSWADLVEVAGDEPVGSRQERSLEGLAEGIAPEDRALPDHRAALEAKEILRGLAELPPDFRDPIRRHTARTTRGMAVWVERGDEFPDEAALDRYMFEVAGRVGLLLTDLFAAHSEAIRERGDELRRTAVSFGLGLQTVNVIRGLHEDPTRGWNYVPRDHLSDGGSCADLRRAGPSVQGPALEFLVCKAGRHIADALDYCRILPRSERGIRIFCIIPALLALRTAQRSAHNLEVFRLPVKITRAEVGRVIFRTRLFFFSNAWLANERRQAVTLATGVSATSAADRVEEGS